MVRIRGEHTEEASHACRPHGGGAGSIGRARAGAEGAGERDDPGASAEPGKGLFGLQRGLKQGAERPLR